jgi:hypothetical protein
MAHDAAVTDEIEARAAARGHEDISDTHARGLRRDLFHIQKVRVGRPLPLLLRRIGTVQWPHRSTREAVRVLNRTRQSFRACSEYLSEVYAKGEGCETVAVIMLPSQRAHADGQEPVLKVMVFLMRARGRDITVECRTVGRISHHAVERMYQRLRTSSHDEVLAELRKAMYWVALLYCSASLAPRSIAIRQLPVPAGRGVLRCVRGEADRLLEVRTFTLHRPGDRIDASVKSLQRWSARPVAEREAGFRAVLREPGNRWWREPYAPPAGPDVAHHRRRVRDTCTGDRV